MSGKGPLLRGPYCLTFLKLSKSRKIALNLTRSMGINKLVMSFYIIVLLVPYWENETFCFSNFSRGILVDSPRGDNIRKIFRDTFEWSIISVILSSLIFVSFSQLGNSETKLRKERKLSGLKLNWETGVLLHFSIIQGLEIKKFKK